VENAVTVRRISDCEDEDRHFDERGRLHIEADFDTEFFEESAAEDGRLLCSKCDTFLNIPENMDIDFWE